MLDSAEDREKVPSRRIVRSGRPRGGVMVASQGSDGQQNAAEMYCGPVGPYGDYYQEHPYYVHHQGAEMCHTHVCSMPGEFGPATVPMVSTNSSPPMAMPVQVPPGHMVQQVVDENGTLRHVIISAQHAQNLMPLPPHNPQHYGNATTTQSQQFYAGPASAGYAPQQFHLHPAHLGNSPPPPPQQPPPTANGPAYYKDERAQRQHSKLRKKLQEKQKSPSTNGKEAANGLRRPSGGGAKDRGMNSVGTSEDGEESSVPDEEDSFHVYITDMLSSVQAPKVSDLSSRSALLQWAPPMRLSESPSVDIEISESDLRYEVLLSDKGKEMKFKSIYSGPSLSCRIQDLKPGQEYSVCLQVHLDELQGSVTDLVKFVTPPCEPDQPQSPKLVNRTKNSLHLKWNAVNDNGAPVLYVLEYDEGKGGDFVEFYKGRNKTHMLQKLQPATEYAFRLAAVNEAGRSAYSPTVAYGTCDHAPSQPLPPALVEAGVSSLRVEWARRPRDREFVLQMDDERTKYGFLNAYAGKETAHAATGLREAGKYSFRLRAKNDGGESPWSEAVTYCTLPKPPIRPSKPVVKGRIHAHSFKLKWEPPIDSGGSEIIKYILEMNSSGGGYETVYEGPETEAVCDKLSAGITYQLRVGCQSAGGLSQFSDPCTVMTEAVSPGRCAQPRLVGKVSANAVTIRWADPEYLGGAPLIDFEVEMTPPDGPATLVHKGANTECSVSTLEPGRDYAFAVRAVNRVGPGAWSEPLRVTSGAAPPDAPAVPRLACKSATHVRVEWAEPRCNGAAVGEYQVEMSRQAEEEELFGVVYQGQQASCDVKGLMPFHSYSFRVQAGNSAGFSSYSPVASTTTPAAAPAAVAALKADATPTSISLRWAAPADHGSAVTHYNVELADWTIATDGPVTEYVVEGLQPDTVYKVKVQAVNAVGAGPFSGSTRVSTLRLPPVAPRLECLATAHNYIKLKWGEGKNLEYTQYCVEMENPRSREYQCVYKGTALTCKVNKLHEQTSYRFRINAASDAGAGAFSPSYEFATATAPPAAVKAPKVGDVEQRSCALEWLPAKNSFADAVVYHVQIAKAKEAIFRQVHRTSETKTTLEDLEPGTEYSARIGPVRLTAAGELSGPFSPTVAFATPPVEAEAAPAALAAPHHHHASRHRSLYHSVWHKTKFLEEYCTYVYAVLVLVLGIVISLGITSFL